MSATPRNGRQWGSTIGLVAAESARLALNQRPLLRAEPEMTRSSDFDYYNSGLDTTNRSCGLIELHLRRHGAIE